jgi:hypothetical protein
MNKYMAAMGALAFTVVGTLSADTVPTKTKTASVVKKTTVASSGPVDRILEIRAGPRVSFLTGGLRVGKTGTEVDIWDDLGQDDVNVGAQIDLDWQPWNRIHTTFGMTYDRYDHSGTTSKGVLTNRGDVIQPGARVTSDVDFYTFEGKVGYDVIKNNTFRVQTYIGGKGVFLDGTVSASGTVITAAPGSVTRTGSRSTKIDNSYGTFFGGVDSRAYISRDWYVGGDIGAFGLDGWSYLTGDAYTGYDFNKNLRSSWE